MIVTRALALIALAVVAGGVHALVSDNPIVLGMEQPPPAQPAAAVADSDDQPDAADPVLDAPVKAGALTLRQAHELWELGAVFLDARREEQFNEGRIEGAYWMPASRVSSAAGQTDIDFMDPAATVVIYCVGGECDASENTAAMLSQLNGFTDLRIMGLGYDDWAAAGLPVETSEASP